MNMNNMEKWVVLQVIENWENYAYAFNIVLLYWSITKEGLRGFLS